MRAFFVALPLSFAFAAGCAVEPTDPEPGESIEYQERAPLGKADKAGSCFAANGEDTLCGGHGRGNCWCDAACEYWGDCCADYTAACGPACDPNLVCTQVLTCVDGDLYPTGCGPANCDEPIGPCEPEPTCDPTLICTQVLTCVNGQLYPTGCGPANCDEPIGGC